MASLSGAGRPAVAPYGVGAYRLKGVAERDEAKNMAVQVLAPAHPVARRRDSTPTAATGVALLSVIAVAAVLRILAGSHPRVIAGELGFVSLVAESVPFLLAGALLSNVLRSRLGRRLLTAAAGRPRLAAALAPFAGLALPLCDCGLLPLARELREGGAARAVNAFLAGAPLTNPIVIVTTLLAFPHSPGVAAARLVCGFAVAAAAGAFVVAPRSQPHAHTAACEPETGGPSWLAAAGAELTGTAPALVVGAALAATFKAVIPTGALLSLGHQPLAGAAAMMLLAFVMSICSQADAFVAAALPVGVLPQLAFMVCGPVLDLRLAVLYRREFGTPWVLSYAAVVVPVALVAVTVCATVGLA